MRNKGFRVRTRVIKDTFVNENNEVFWERITKNITITPVNDSADDMDLIQIHNKIINALAD